MYFFKPLYYTYILVQWYLDKQSHRVKEQYISVVCVRPTVIATKTLSKILMSFSAQVFGRKISGELFNEKFAYIVSKYSKV